MAAKASAPLLRTLPKVPATSAALAAPLASVKWLCIDRACRACRGGQLCCRAAPHCAPPPPAPGAGDGGWAGPGLPARLLRRGGAPAHAAPRPPGPGKLRLIFGNGVACRAGHAGALRCSQHCVPWRVGQLPTPPCTHATLLRRSCLPAWSSSTASACRAARWGTRGGAEWQAGSGCSEARGAPHMLCGPAVVVVGGGGRRSPGDSPAPCSRPARHPTTPPHPQGILLLEFCAGRDLQSALGVTRQNGRGRLFGWYAHGRQVALDVAKVGGRAGGWGSSGAPLAAWGCPQPARVGCQAAMHVRAWHGNPPSSTCPPATCPSHHPRRRSTICIAGPSCIWTSRAAM